MGLIQYDYNQFVNAMKPNSNYSSNQLSVSLGCENAVRENIGIPVLLAKLRPDAPPCRGGAWDHLFRECHKHFSRKEFDAVSFTLNANISARIAGHHSWDSRLACNKSMACLSTGRKLESSGDDAGGLSQSSKLQSRVQRTSAVGQNAQNAISYLQVQDAALDSLGDILNRFGELRTMTDDITKNSSDIKNYNHEFIELQIQFNSLSLETFNGIDDFVVDQPVSAVNRELGAVADDHEQCGGHAMDFARYSRTPSLHPSGDPNSGSISISMVNLDFIQTINFGAINPDYLTLEPNGDEYIYSVLAIPIGQTSNALAKVASTRTQNGAEENEVMKYSQDLKADIINLGIAIPRILDADIAKESTQLAKYKILSEISVFMNPQANQLNNSALTLIRSN